MSIRMSKETMDLRVPRASRFVQAQPSLVTRSGNPAIMGSYGGSMRIEPSLLPRTPSREGNVGWLVLGVALGAILIVVGILKAIF